MRGRRTDPGGVPTITTPYPGGTSWGGPFEAIDDDGRSYYVKALGTCQPGGEASLAIELVVARVGRLIGAPTCETTVIRIPAEFEGHEVSPGRTLSAGFAHAALTLVGQVDERRPALDARDKDDNSRRHVGAYALFDWCVGADQQWLHQVDKDATMWSHDHGLYLPPPHNGFWTVGELEVWVDRANPLPDAADGLDGDVVEATAKALEDLDRDGLVGVLCAVPASWPVDDEDLEALDGSFKPGHPASLSACVRWSDPGW